MVSISVLLYGGNQLDRMMQKKKENSRNPYFP